MKKNIEVRNQRSAPADSIYFDPSFSAELIAWQKQHGRHSLPWQQTGDAYKVWLSEIMLQQTQVTAVIPYYQRFLEKFPTVEDLAAAPVEEVMASWAGLGYYTRARNLHQCAKQVVEKYQGRFPSDPKLLQELPGIGRSTAAAVAAFSYGTVAAILDGNVKRVFARVFGIAAYPGTKSVEDDLWLRAEALLPESDITAYTQGLMDLGATLCSRGKPDCQRCPFQARCIAFAQGRTAELPIRKPKTKQKEKHSIMLVLEHDGAILLEQRPMTGIWGGLVSLPELHGMREGALMHADGLELVDDALSYLDCVEAQRFVNRFGVSKSVTLLAPFEHGFTHFRLHIHAIHFTLSRKIPFASDGGFAWTSLDNIEQLALPAPVKALLLNLNAD
nr:A/G-specific adenine glycosylase [uncultured Undibacterium sp.]